MVQCMCVQRSENYLQKLVCFFQGMGFRNVTQDEFHLQRHLTGPTSLYGWDLSLSWSLCLMVRSHCWEKYERISRVWSVTQFSCLKINQKKDILDGSELRWIASKESWSILKRLNPLLSLKSCHAVRCHTARNRHTEEDILLIPAKKI